MKIVDTTFLIDLLRGRKEVQNLLGGKEELLVTQINMYEVIRGFFIKDIAPSKLIKIKDLFETITVLPLDDASIVKSADISAQLIKKGETIGDADCLIAGIALSNGIKTIVTKNSKDFQKIPGLKVETY